jgi:hypothetical protein
VGAGDGLCGLTVGPGAVAAGGANWHTAVETNR